jgi:two-component system response regulator GlrR
MKIFRCAVVAADGSPAAACDVVAALTRCKAADVYRCDNAPLGDSAVTAVVFVTCIGNLQRTVARIAEVRHLTPATAVLVAIEDAQVDTLDALLVAGAFDFVSIPFTPGELVTRLHRAMGLSPEAPHTDMQNADHPRVRGLIYSSSAMAQVAIKLGTIAACDANLLILGATGTGKEVCALAAHYLSARASRPWIAVNCGAIPAELVENELFGHVKGAYTTALSARAGLVREAEGGTLFLDDVDCLPLPAQAKLLRFLQEREYRPVGSNTVYHADVRVIAASNCDLHALALRGAFRQDLYFRLNVLRLNLPALADRREDVAVLAQHFVRHFSREFKRPVHGLTPSALQLLAAHDWPGNVRELKHVIERAVLMSTSPALVACDLEIESDAPVLVTDNSFRNAKSRVVRSFERGYVEQMLSASCGNVTQAARAAKKDRRAFFELMRKHDIQPQQFRSLQQP